MKVIRAMKSVGIVLTVVAALFAGSAASVSARSQRCPHDYVIVNGQCIDHDKVHPDGRD